MGGGRGGLKKMNKRKGLGIRLDMGRRRKQESTNLESRRSGNLAFVAVRVGEKTRPSSARKRVTTTPLSR